MTEWCQLTPASLGLRATTADRYRTLLRKHSHPGAWPAAAVEPDSASGRRAVRCIEGSGYYEPLTLAETVHYLRTVADAVETPIMLYNLPSATGVNLSPDTVGQLAREVENIRYIKDTSADMAQAGRLIHNYGDVIGTFVGWDSLLLAALTEGATGVMAGTANVMPAELVSIYEALTAGELDRARAEWAMIYPLMDAIMSAPFIPAIKTALQALGCPSGSPRPPLLDLDAATAVRISALALALARRPDADALRASDASLVLHPSKRCGEAGHPATRNDRHPRPGGWHDSLRGPTTDDVDVLMTRVAPVATGLVAPGSASGCHNSKAQEQ